MLELVLAMLVSFALGLDIGSRVMVWAHDNKRLRYKNGCREGGTLER
jgi:hypothetical protein